MKGKEGERVGRKTGNWGDDLATKGICMRRQTGNKVEGMKDTRKIKKIILTGRCVYLNKKHW